MDNKKIPTSIGAIVLVIIAITVGAFVWVYEKGQNMEITWTQTQPLPKKVITTEESQKSIVDSGAMIAEPIEQWKICRNEKSGYEVKYPSTWVLGLRGPYGFEQLKDCTSTWIYFTDQLTPANVGKISVIINLFDTTGQGMVYQGSTSIQSFLEKSQFNLTISKKTIISGEEANWVGENRVLIYHNYKVLDIRFAGLDNKFFDDFLSTFKFLN